MRHLYGVLPLDVWSPQAAVRRWLRLLCLLLVPATWLWSGSSASAASVTSAPQTGIAVEGQFGGYAAALAAGRTTVYLALGPRVAAVDTTNPATPRQLGQSPLLPGDVQHLALRGTTLVATYQPPIYPNLPTGLATFDVSDPSVPRAEGRFSLPNRVDALAIAGSVAYVALGSSQGTGSSILAIDLRNAGNPQRLGQYVWRENTSPALAVAGSTVYLLLGDTMRIVSFANPAQPALLATTTLPALASGPTIGRAIAVTGSTLTITQGEVGERSNGVGVLRTFDVSDPRRPRPLGLLTGLGYPSNGLAVTGQTAFVAANDGIHVVDLGDLGQPRQLAVMAGNPQARALALSGDALVVRQGGATPVAVVDVTHPAQPQVVGTLPAVTGVEGLALAGTTLSVSNSVFALDVLDVSDPSRPALRSQLAVAGGIVALAAAPSYVYAVGGPQTRNGQFVPGLLTVIDVADPARPALVGTLALNGNPRAIAVTGQHVLVATTGTCAGPGNTGGGLTVIDVADPTHPIPAGVLPLSVGCEARLQVVAAGTSAYLTASLGKTGGVLDIVDVADPQHPTLTATVPEPTYPTPAVAGHTVYLGLGSSLHVLDVADPAHPREVAVVASPGLLAALALSGRTLVGSGADTTEVFDLAQPAQPVLAGTYRGLGTINLAVEGDRIYVGTLFDGVWVLRARSAAKASLAAPPAVPHDARYFPQTGYRISDNTFWNYFTQRGGIGTFGYPTSRVFTFEGFPVQFFQRQVMQRFPDGSVRLLNLLDSGLMPYTTFNGSVVPAADPSLQALAPPAGSPGYADAVVRFVQQHAPDTWNGLPVHFQQTFRHSISLADAFPSGNADPALLPLLDLEVWGLPTSRPAYDPNNHQFVYQRFQRGIMHFAAACACTRGLLLADYLKAILTATNLPTGLAGEAANSPFFAQYCPGATDWLCRPEDLPATNLTNAFVPQ